MIEDFLLFAEGPLLPVVFYFFIGGVASRTLFFIFKNPDIIHMIRSLFPLHRAAVQRPIYTLLRYLFHGMMFTVAVWYSGHVEMWYESRFEWYWEPLPESVSDMMTLGVIALAVFFLFRRILIPKIRKTSSILDYFIIFIASAPFISGYWYARGTLDHIQFFNNYLWYFHVISGEAMMIMTVFLFCRTRLNRDRCVGCAACVLTCPTDTLEASDKGAHRVLSYAHCQCIHCASCVSVCPEDAAQLRHEISLPNFFRIQGRQEIRTVEISKCRQCGMDIGPLPQLNKIETTIKTNDYEIENLYLCHRCKMAGILPT